METFGFLHRPAQVPLMAADTGMFKVLKAGTQMFIRAERYEEVKYLSLNFHYKRRKIMVNKINRSALDELSKHNWKIAQKMLFDNAKKHPCHETFNNLGYYLCTEGLECKNNKV